MFTYTKKEDNQKVKIEQNHEKDFYISRSCNNV